MSFFKKALLITMKDLKIEMRSKEVLLSMLIFVLIVVAIFQFAFEPGTKDASDYAPGLLWVAFTFAGVLGLSRTFMIEKENDCLQGLMLCPVDRGAIFLGKMIANIIFMGVMEAIALPLFSIFSNFNILPHLKWLALIMALSTIGFSCVGTLFSSMSVNTKTREVMLPILLFPIIVPIIIGAVKSTGRILLGDPYGNFAAWVKLLAAFDLIFLVACYLVFDFVIEE